MELHTFTRQSVEAFFLSPAQLTLPSACASSFSSCLRLRDWRLGASVDDVDPAAGALDAAGRADSEADSILKSKLSGHVIGLKVNLYDYTVLVPPVLSSMLSFET